MFSPETIALERDRVRRLTTYDLGVCLPADITFEDAVQGRKFLYFEDTPVLGFADDFENARAELRYRREANVRDFYGSVELTLRAGDPIHILVSDGQHLTVPTTVLDTAFVSWTKRLFIHLVEVFPGLADNSNFLPFAKSFGRTLDEYE